MLLLMGVPVFTLSTRFLENSRNICSFSFNSLASLIKDRTNGSKPEITPSPIIRKKNFVSTIKNERLTIIKEAASPMMCIFLIFILLSFSFLRGKREKFPVFHFTEFFPGKRQIYFSFFICLIVLYEGMSGRQCL